MPSPFSQHIASVVQASARLFSDDASGDKSIQRIEEYWKTRPKDVTEGLKNYADLCSREVAEVSSGNRESLEKNKFLIFSKLNPKIVNSVVRSLRGNVAKQVSAALKARASEKVAATFREPRASDLIVVSDERAQRQIGQVERKLSERKKPESKPEINEELWRQDSVTSSREQEFLELKEISADSALKKHASGSRFFRRLKSGLSSFPRFSLGKRSAKAGDLIPAALKPFVESVQQATSAKELSTLWERFTELYPPKGDLDKSVLKAFPEHGGAPEAAGFADLSRLPKENPSLSTQSVLAAFVENGRLGETVLDKLLSHPEAKGEVLEAAAKSENLGSLKRSRIFSEIADRVPAKHTRIFAKRLRKAGKKNDLTNLSERVTITPELRNALLGKGMKNEHAWFAGKFKRYFSCVLRREGNSGSTSSEESYSSSQQLGASASESKKEILPPISTKERQSMSTSDNLSEELWKALAREVLKKNIGSQTLEQIFAHKHSDSSIRENVVRHPNMDEGTLVALGENPYAREVEACMQERKNQFALQAARSSKRSNAVTRG